MPKTHTLRTTAAVVLFAVIVGLSFAEEPPTPYVLNWRRLVGKPLYSSVAVADSLVYIGSGDGYFYCLKGDGTALWRYQIGGENFLTALTEQVVLVGSRDEHLYALDRLSGELKWELLVKGVATEAIADKGGVFFGTTLGYVYALDPKTGKISWKYRTTGAITSTPAVDLAPNRKAGARRVYFGSQDSRLQAVSRDDGLSRWEFQTKGAIGTELLLAEEGVYFGCDDSYFYALDSEDGSLLWKWRTGGKIKSSPAVWGDKVFFGSSNGWIYALSLDEGRLIWKYEAGAQVNGSPCVGPNGTLFVGDDDGALHAIDAATGKERWSFKVSSPVRTRPVVSGNTLYFSAGDGYLYSLSIAPPYGSAIRPVGVYESYTENLSRWESQLLWEDWGEQFYKGAKTGYFHEMARKVASGIKLWTEEVNWENGFRRTFSERLADSRYRLLFFKDRRVEASQVLITQGEVRGDSLFVERRLAEEVIKKAIPINRDVICPEFAYRLIFKKEAVSVGQSYSVPVFDYDTLKECNLSMTVVGRDTLRLEEALIPAFVVDKAYDLGELEGIEVREWVDADGRTLAAEIPDFGISLKVVPKSQAIVWKEFKEESMVASDVRINSPHKVNSLAVRLKINREQIERVLAPLNRYDLTGLIQEERQGVDLESDTTAIVLTERASISSEEALNLPISDACLPRPTRRRQEGISKFLEPTIFIQCKNPRIVELSREIVGDEKNSWLASKRLLEWVYNNMVAKETNVGFKSALEVLEDMEGTCSEYVVLFIALARAAGIPARACAGLMASGQGSFGLHMWAQVYVGRWVDVDPSWNQMNVDATHIEFANGSLAFEEMLGFNVPLSLALAQLDTVRVISYEIDRRVELTAANRLFQKASDLQAQFQDQEALKLFREVTEFPLNSRSDDAFCQIGEILMEKNDIDGARDAFKKVLEKFPGSDSADDALFKLAKVWEKQGKPDSAQAYFQRLVEEFPDSEFADDALYRIGEIYEKDFTALTAAEQVYRKVIEDYAHSGWAICAREGLKRCADREKHLGPNN